ncbi:MAG: NAD(P)(+) transhydrogenase (Re/Si-specific) subunit beta [Clostridia bacterium]|nr:NAD(P)(+) transhydrogenase (Re/Si-specific) subunit beta [Clostridia bacterium]
MAPTTFLYLFFALSAVLSAFVLVGLSMQSKVRFAVRGNLVCVAVMLLAIVLTFWKELSVLVAIQWLWILFAALGAMAIGLVIGLFWAKKVKMIEMPQTVALLNGIGGLASALVGGIELAKADSSVFANVTAALALVIGAITFTGSLIAALKLARKIDSRPKKFRGHSIVSAALLIACLAGVVCAAFGLNIVALIICAIAALLFGWLFAMRVGGADMPVAISLLNSLSGVAGAIAGMAISNVLLVAVGGIVGSSGLLLTQIMCRAMNRHLMDILLGKTVKLDKPAEKKEPSSPAPEPEPAPAPEPEHEAAFSLKDAKNVIIVPGYGMALSQAQHKVKELSDKLEANGATVRFAIHPVAGRMPGHMNVLLAEADVDYEHLYELDAINDDFKSCDAVVVVGASDVMNPAAREAEGTPIYGMPILNVDEAPEVIVCNFDLKPGYAGVENPLYTRGHGLRLLLGDAKDSLDILISELSESKPKPEAAEASAVPEAAFSLKDAKNVIIVPGYGMALSQAQHKVKELSDKLEANGATVRFAIHPVAGRMPGHMNVLLAEADVDYEHLYELDAINDDFKSCDAVVVVGASDVMNPAAREAEGTPIYGMPILNVDEAPEVIVCNFDLKPGYAGVENPLYTRGHGIRLLLGDAKDSLDILINEL